MEYVRLDDVHKRYYRRYGAPSLRLQQGRKRTNDVDEAINGCSLTVGRGEAVAVLGLRHSGRSTLISLIAGLYRPDQGTVRVRGRPTGLIAVGAGFSPTVPVRNCISLNAALLGMGEEQLDASMDEVLDFAGVRSQELGYPLRELPGSKRRLLAYALAVRSRPDVFLADGKVVLGNDEMAERCFESLESLRADGQAQVLATNNKTVVRRLADRAIVLDEGRIAFDGSVGPALKALKRLRRG
jgi:ABC-2 type transport system ATP-binding protein